MNPHPTGSFGLPPRRQRERDEQEDLAASAARADLMVAVFLLGVMLGWLLGKGGFA